jgi:hypothetical protein
MAQPVHFVVCLATVAAVAFASISFGIPWAGAQTETANARIADIQTNLVPLARAEVDRIKLRLKDTEDRWAGQERLWDDGRNRMTSNGEADRQIGAVQARVAMESMEALRPELEERRRQVALAELRIRELTEEITAQRNWSGNTEALKQTMINAGVPLCFILLSCSAGSFAAWARARTIGENTNTLTIIGGAVALPLTFLFAETFLPSFGLSGSVTITDVTKVIAVSAFGGLIAVEIFSGWRLRAQVAATTRPPALEA